MDSVVWVLAAAAAFVGSHFLLSHPLRRPIVGVIGEGAFAGVYSLVAAATLVWLALAYRSAQPTAPLWPVGDVLWATATVLMLLASILLMGSLIRNPALPTGGAPAKFPETARGVFAITPHPMLWAFALWGLCHIAVYPMMKNIIVAVAIIVLALVGAILQDRKKEGLEPALRPAWEAKTSYLPFAARRQRQGAPRRVRSAHAHRRLGDLARRHLGAQPPRGLGGRRVALGPLEIAPMPMEPMPHHVAPDSNGRTG